MSEYTIRVRFDGKIKTANVTSDYNLFLQRIQAKYKFSSELMSSLKIVYKDPDEPENSTETIVIESNNEYQDFIQEYENSYIILSFPLGVWEEEKKKRKKEEKEKQEKEEKAQRERELKEKMEREQHEKELQEKLEREQKAKAEREQKEKAEREESERIEREHQEQLKREQEEKLKRQQEEKERADELKRKKERQDQKEKERADLKQLLEKLSTAHIDLKKETTDIKSETKEIKEALQAVVPELTAQLLALIKKEMEASQQNQLETALLQKKKLKEEQLNSIIHKEIQCSYCNMSPIKGFRYKCSQCSNLNLCRSCFKSYKQCKHTFFIIKDSTEFDEEQKELQRVKQEEEEKRNKEMEQLFADAQKQQMEKKDSSPEKGMKSSHSSNVSNEQGATQPLKNDIEDTQNVEKQDAPKNDPNEDPEDENNYEKEFQQFSADYGDYFEKAKIIAALRKTKGNIEKALELLT